MRGSRQDIILEASLAIYMSQEVNIEVLDESLQMSGKRRDNILMKNIFVLLAFIEMAVKSRFLCIVYFAICIPMHFLAGMTPKLKDFSVVAPPEEKWCTRSMVRVLDTLDEKIRRDNCVSFPFPQCTIHDEYLLLICQ